MAREIECYKYGTPLSGGLDTYGLPGAEMCWPCYSADNAQEQKGDSWYGLAPHQHVLAEDGSICTVAEPLTKREPGGGAVSWRAASVRWRNARPISWASRSRGSDIEWSGRFW